MRIFSRINVACGLMVIHNWSDASRQVTIKDWHGNIPQFGAALIWWDTKANTIQIMASLQLSNPTAPINRLRLINNLRVARFWLSNKNLTFGWFAQPQSFLITNAGNKIPGPAVCGIGRWGFWRMTCGSQWPRSQRHGRLITDKAVNSGLTLVTNNQDDFKGYPGLVIANWAVKEIGYEWI